MLEQSKALGYRNEPGAVSGAHRWRGGIDVPITINKR